MDNSVRVNRMLVITLVAIFAMMAFSCIDPTDSDENPEFNQEAVLTAFGGQIDLNNLPNYANQEIPGYIDEDNTSDNPITDGGAVLGRVLFYDKNLSSDNTIACGSCHQQSYAFSDILDASQGVNGTTGRHSMRLINARFAAEEHFFWDERASTLEEQTTMPIQDHAEMGFSGENGDPDFGDLIVKLSAIEYYQELFEFVYGDQEITEERMQLALAQFIRSIQSFDSKFDIGRSQARDDQDNFTNFTDDENEGKRLFMNPPNRGGAGCAGCHRAPEFDIDPDIGNNGVTGSFSGEADLNVTRSPTLRDLVGPNGGLNLDYAIGIKK